MKRIVIILIFVLSCFMVGCTADKQIKTDELTNKGNIAQIPVTNIQEKKLPDNEASDNEPSVTAEPGENNQDELITVTPTAEATATAEPEPIEPQPLSPPAQPIDFESYEAILNFIRNYDGTGDSCPEANAAWPDEFVDKYLEMNERFKKEGFFYEIVNSPDSEISRYVLFPNAKYEDIGVCCYIVYRETLYQCIVYSTKENYDLFSEGHSLYEYMKWRMNNPNLREDIRDKTQSCEVLRYDGGKTDGSVQGSYSYMETPIDNTHYLMISSGNASYERIMNIYRLLTVKKIPIYN